MTIAVVPLRFRIGARTLASIPRRLERVALSLDDVMAQVPPTLPPPSGDGYQVTSLPAGIAVDHRELRVLVRQRYVRHHVDLAAGEAAWSTGLSATTRSTMRRKVKKLAALSGGTIDIRRYRTPAEIGVFHPLARAVSATTYQERLMGEGLPRSPEDLVRRAAADAVRCWLLFLDRRPIAYLCCTQQGSALRYDYVGHDPALAAVSPGAVLLAAAITDLFADRFALFDFTEGDGQHKRQFATGGTACVDLLMLCPTIANRAVMTALATFDAAMALGKRATVHPALAAQARKIRRSA